jgi:anthranilate phosphoribosyltransferase
MTLRDRMRESIGGLLDGSYEIESAIARLTSIDIDKLMPSQLAGAAEAVMERALPFPAHPEALDCCGTGGDGLHTLNISTATAIVAAACGVTMVKHGNRAVTSKSGSADVLRALGMEIDLSAEQAEKLLQEVGITFLFAPNFHPGFARVAPIRQAVGTRTIFNLLGPLCNPAKPKRQLIGVFAAHHCALMAEAAQMLRFEHVMAVHGNDGSDELSISGGTHVAELQHDKVEYLAVRPQDAGLKPHPLSELKGGSAIENAEAMRLLFKGRESAYADAVVLNAAAVLVLADKAKTLYDGALLARNAIALGKAQRKLDALVEASHSV